MQMGNEGPLLFWRIIVWAAPIIGGIIALIANYKISRIELQNKQENEKTEVARTLVQGNISVKNTTNTQVIGNIEKQIINNFQSEQKNSQSDKMKNSNNENEKTVNVTSYNQSGGITANQVNIGTVPRVINPESESLFLNEIKKFPPKHIKIKALFSDSESQSLSIMIKNVFEKAGWTVDELLYELPHPPIDNVIIGVPEAEKSGMIINIINGWLQNLNNIETVQNYIPEGEGKEYLIFVGQNKSIATKSK